jgi:AMP phosphorylase
VKKGDVVMTIYAEKQRKLKRVEEIYEEMMPVGIGEKREMLIHEVREAPIAKKMFTIER